MIETFGIATAHYVHSSLRERIVEHVFIGETLRRLWQLGITDVEVLRAEFDAGGYDLVLSWRSIIRHIQFKTMVVGGKRARVGASLKLAEKPSGCILWIMITPDLAMHSFRWFGSAPGKPLPMSIDLPVLRHTKGDASGVKGERPGHREISLKHFEVFNTLDEVLIALFGEAILAVGDELVVEEAVENDHQELN